jgi:formate hydrogenlyase subunit 4
MRTLFVVLVAAAILLFVLLAVRSNTEPFDNTGALMQLASSHVPTEEDVEDARMYRRQVQSDLVDMTGSA